MATQWADRRQWLGAAGTALAAAWSPSLEVPAGGTADRERCHDQPSDRLKSRRGRHGRRGSDGFGHPQKIHEPTGALMGRGHCDTDTGRVLAANFRPLPGGILG